jgi:hypothetical protein
MKIQLSLIEKKYKENCMFWQSLAQNVRIPTILYGMLVRTEHVIRVSYSHFRSTLPYPSTVSGKMARSCQYSSCHGQHPWPNGQEDVPRQYVSMFLCVFVSRIRTKRILF